MAGREHSCRHSNVPSILRGSLNNKANKSWHKKFRDGLEDVSDRPRTGRPGRSEQDVRRIRDAISEDRRRSVREISYMTGICVNVVYRTLTETLKMNKVCARWVPRLLQQDQKAARVRLSRSFLNRYNREGDQFLHRVVTMDKP